MLEMKTPEQPAAKDPLSERVIGAAIEVHRELGPGLLESVYEECLALELRDGGLPVRRQVELPLRYKGRSLEVVHRLDLVLDGRLIIELKCVERLLPIHDAQLLTYLRLSGIRTGLLLNFNTPVMFRGVKRLVL